MRKQLFAYLLIVAGVPTAWAEPALLGHRYVIDVRTEQEWQAGHIEGAVLIPYDQIADRIGAVIADKHAPIALYCRSGRRSGIALKTLTDRGYTDVVNYGGFEEAKQKVAASLLEQKP